MEKKKPNQTLLMTINQYDVGRKFLDLMRVQYPNCFYPAGYEKPLCKTIGSDLYDKAGTIETDLAKNAITAALRIYTSSLSYRAGVIREESERVNLQGEVTEPVTDEERTHAKFRALQLNWKLSASERPLVNALKARDKAYRQQKYLAWKSKQPPKT